MEILLLTASSFLFVFALAAALITRAKRDKLAADKRLYAILGTSEAEQIRKRVRSDRKSSRIKISQAMVDQLASAGVPMRAEEYMTAWIALSLIPPVIASLLGARFSLSLILLGVFVLLPPLYVRQSRKKRLLAFESQLGDAMISISNCLKSGLTFQQGLKSVAEQMPEPVSKEFARTLREVQLGNTMEGALNNLARRVPSADLKLMIAAVLITQQVGGSLSEVMDTIAATIIDRLKIKNEVRTLTSQGRMSGIIIGVLPIGIGLILTVINPSYMRFFIDEEAGRVMLAVAAAMEVVGAFVIKRLVTIKY